MKLTDSDLQNLFQEHTARASRPPGGCPAPEALTRARMGELDEASQARIAGHLARCSDCAGEYQLLGGLKAVLDDAPDDVAPNVVPFPETPVGRREALWRSFAAAAMLVLVAGVSFAIWRAAETVPAGPARERSGQTLPLQTVPVHNALLSEPPSQLSWEPIPEAIAYQVRVFDADSTPLWTSDFSVSTQIAVPETVRASLPRATPIYWRVVVSTSVDQRASSLLRFTIDPGASQ